MLDLLARVGGGDDLADALLVEALEAVVAFEVFEVGADSALGAELVGLFGGVMRPMDRRCWRRGSFTTQRSPSVKAWRR